MKYQLIKVVDALGLRKLVTPFYYGYQKRRKAALYRANEGRVLSASDSHEWLRRRLREGGPLAAGKIGSLEAEALLTYMRADDPTREKVWADLRDRLYANVGVFPPTAETFSRFCEVFSESLSGMDGLAVWFSTGEQESIEKWAPQVQQAEFSMLEPYKDERPWTMELQGRRVVVVSPFKQSIEQQWPRIQDVWSRHPIWPEGIELSVVQAPFSAALVEPRDADWFAALDRLTEKLRSLDFDTALIGAGGYSLPLCTRVKEMGRRAIHTGGATQIFFGIMGKRWRGDEIEERFANEFWIDPLPAELPENRAKVEGGCYW